ncbi:uncharacterized protein DNG_07825 [Cephalotrichum gorgonifer]|uniref:Nephrocystin 3-like N-terminal domain-containing protein n=1 Tax=Cephalotrichum gorgonifer TaxID=2041049 RepID=A0AAE8N450_9PEZI|nr:uncharacterized protein DNG_07825 [Cephalotrichum gorgonifer]
MIISFFDIMNSFLERISTLENRMPNEWQFRKFLVNVFSALLTLSAIARKCRQKGRLSKWAKALVDGSDPKLKGAFDSLHMHLQRFESATMLSTLRHTLESGKKLDTLGQDVKQIQSGVEQNLALSQQNYVLGLETKGHAKDAALTSHEILAVVTRQEDRGTEYTAGLQQVMKTLNKMNRTKGGKDLPLDAGARKSIAMRTLETLLAYNVDDKAHLAEIENHYVNGTYGWFREQEVYDEFEAGSVPLLCVSGPPGMGKSTLAYTVVKALQSEFVGEASTSVAHCFFREDDDRTSVTKMLRSCALQVAARDTGYREEVLVELQQKVQQLRDADPIRENEEVLWDMMFKTKFQKKTGRRLVLVIDGADEADEKGRDYLETILEDIAGSEDTNIQVLLTSDPKIFSPDQEATKLKLFEMTKEHILPDIRTIIIGRLKILGRLRKLSQRTKRRIIARLSKQADTIRYVDHMLRRLNQIGREKAILRELDNLPSTTPDLYKILLDDCQKGRSEQDILVLRKFFAWLAYSKDSLSLGSASKLLNFIANDNNISIDEELENRCARLLRLSNAKDENDNESQDDSDSDKFDDDKAADEDEDTTEDLQVLLGFQEKGLRAYFKPTDNLGGDKLRSSASSGHAMIFEVIDSILSLGSDNNANPAEQQLQRYAAKNWGQHLQEIDPAELTDEENARIIESICSILSNRGGSIRRMEEHGRDWESSEPPSVLGPSGPAADSVLQTLQAWAVKTTKMPSAAISGATVAWMRPFVRNPRTVFVKLADAHVTNWLTSYGTLSEAGIHNCFAFAHEALYQGRELPAVQQNEALRTYFVKREEEKEEGFSEESYKVVSKAFLHIDMTAQSYLSIVKAMWWSDLMEQCLEQLDIAIQHTDTDMDTIETYMHMAEYRVDLAERAESRLRDWNDETEGKEGDDKVTLQAKYEKWVEDALSAIVKASDLVADLPESTMDDTKSRSVIRDVWMLRAKVDLLRNDASKTLEYCNKALEWKNKDDQFSHFNLIPQLGRAKEWSTILDVFRVLSFNKSSSFMYLYNNIDDIHNAAKHTGETELVLEKYRYSEIVGLSPEITLSINWANFYRDVVGTPDAVAKAKSILNRAIDTGGSMNVLTLASFYLTNILLEEFRGTTQPGAKRAAYREMQDLVKRVSESMGVEFDPTQSQTVIPLAHMARKMDAFEFQQGLERTFNGCVKALTDEIGWNDKPTMRILARVLALVGLERDAQIAATCQLYIINMEIFNRENDTGAEAKVEEEKGEEGDGDGEKGEGGQTNGASTDSSVAPAPSEPQVEEKKGGDGTEEAGAGPKGEDDVQAPDVDEDLDGFSGGFGCDGCGKVIGNWSDGSAYMCYYCTDVDFCQTCFAKRAERDDGRPEDGWKSACPKGHLHIKAPVEGWKGLKGGVLRFEDKEVPFHHWLTELKEKTWPEAWERFWSEEQC